MCEEKFYCFDESFSDFKVYNENDVLEVTQTGILFKDSTVIDFKLCSESFSEMHKDSPANCVGERFLPFFVFYTKPLPTKLVFKKRNFIFEFLSPLWRRGYNFKKLIENCGYCTIDMT